MDKFLARHSPQYNEWILKLRDDVIHKKIHWLSYKLHTIFLAKFFTLQLLQVNRHILQTL